MKSGGKLQVTRAGCGIVGFCWWPWLQRRPPGRIRRWRMWSRLQAGDRGLKCSIRRARLRAWEPPTDGGGFDSRPNP